MFNIFKKKTNLPNMVEVTVVYTQDDEEAIIKLKKKYEMQLAEYEKHVNLGLKDVKKPNVPSKLPTKEDRGKLIFNLSDIDSVNESENPEHSLIVLSTGMQFICDCSILKIKSYLRTKGYEIDEL